MTMRKTDVGTGRANWKGVLPVLAVLAGLGQAGARPLITINDVPDSPALIAAFATADGDTGHDYKLVLRWRKDGNGNTVKWGPLSTVTLKRGHVYVLGSQSNNYPERYIFDGQGARNLFAVKADAGYKPTLTLSGLTVQNGYSDRRGGGLSAYGADDIQIYYCRFLNNKSRENGSGLDLQETRNFYMLHSLVDGNWNDQWGSTYNADPALGKCVGGGQTGGGGGITMEMLGGNQAYAWIHNSTISNNRTCRGGGLEFIGKVNVLMYENTVSGNQVTGHGGGILFKSGTGTNYLRFNTIAFNTAGIPVQFSTEERYGGGVALRDYSGVFYYTEGNVIGKNTVRLPMTNWTYKGHDCYASGGSSTAAYTYMDVVGKIDNCGWLFGSYGSWSGIGSETFPVDPYLQSLAVGTTNDGFALPVHIPYSNSILRGAFLASGVYHQCDSRDERGMRRTFASYDCDIGSVEFDGAP